MRSPSQDSWKQLLAWNAWHWDSLLLVNKVESGLAPAHAVRGPVTNDLEPTYLLTAALASCCPLTPHSFGCQASASWRRGPKFFIWADGRGSKLRKLSKFQWLLPVGASRAGDAGGWGAGKQIKPREAAGGDRIRTWVSSYLLLHRLTTRFLHREAPPNLSPGRGARACQPPALPVRTRSAPSKAPGPAPRSLHPTHQPQLVPGRWSSRWRRHASWCAAPAPWYPARSSISRATARPPCPWSSCWTSVSGDVGPGRGLGSCLNFQTRCREGWTHYLKHLGCAFLLNPGTSKPAHLAFLRFAFSLTVCACSSRPLAAPLMLVGLSSSFLFCFCFYFYFLSIPKFSVKIVFAFSHHLTMNWKLHPLLHCIVLLGEDS